MDETEKLLDSELIQIEPFVEAIFQNKLNLYEGLLSLKITFDYFNHSMLYSFPSEPSEQFRFLNASSTMSSTTKPSSTTETTSPKPSSGVRGAGDLLTPPQQWLGCGSQLPHP